MEDKRYSLIKSILEQSYVPQAILGVSIPKSNGKTRLLGIPTVVDRSLQQAASQVLMTKFELEFEPFSYGFRPKKNIQKAASFFAIIILVVFAYFLYDTFRSLSTEEKIAEIIHFEDQRFHSDRLNSYLEETEPEIRRRAALAIGRIGGKNSGEIFCGEPPPMW